MCMLPSIIVISYFLDNALSVSMSYVIIKEMDSNTSVNELINYILINLYAHMTYLIKRNLSTGSAATNIQVTTLIARTHGVVQHSDNEN